jgi:AmmeMemoRadiSam system protein B
MEESTDFRPSPIAGQWYEGNPGQLAASVDKYINDATLPDITGEIIAIIAPHAGHFYSGPVAGYAFSAVKGMEPDLVAVISPMHHPYHEPLLTSDHDAYQTPLGSIPIDRDTLNELSGYLKSRLGFGIKPIRNDREHSLEIELPFLQQVFTKFALLPVMVRDQSVKIAQTLGSALGLVLKERNALLVASTDLSHFNNQETAKNYDLEMLRRIEAFDPEAVLHAEDEKMGYACGRAAVAAVLWAGKELGGDNVQILNYATSGDVSGDFNRVVGYGAAVITKPKGIK